MAKSLPTIIELHRLFQVDFETGILTWRERDDVRKEWNTRHAGTIAGTKSNYGYIRVNMCRCLYTAHRIIWKMNTGEDAPDQIDHINGIRDDNRLINMRSVSRMDNARNSKKRTDNVSGVVGVCWHKKVNKWWARIKVSGKNISLGYFENIEDASDARTRAEKKYGFHENHGRLE